jgi:hypothetical protein
MAAFQAARPRDSEERSEVLIPPEATLVFEIELLAITPGDDAKSPSDIARSVDQ